MDTTTSDHRSTGNSDIRSRLLSLEAGQYHQAWLELLSSQIPNSYAALLAKKDPSGGMFQPVAVVPDTLPDAELFADLVEQVIELDTGLITQLESSSTPDSVTNYALACPVRGDKGLLAVVVIAAGFSDDQQLSYAMKQLQWSGSWIELAKIRQETRALNDNNRDLRGAVELLSRILPEPDFDRAAIRLIVELAELQRCNLVAIGLVKNNRVELCHLSFSAEFSRKMNLVKAIEAAMNEAADQRSLVVFPPLEKSPVVTLAHNALSEKQGGDTLLSVPLYSGDKNYGVVTLLRDNLNRFSPEDGQYTESILALSAAALEDKQRNSQPLWRKILTAGSEQLQKWLGQGYPGRKLLLLSGIIITVFLSVAEGQYRLSSSAILETARKRIIVAPYDGYIREAPVRAGDSVTEGQLLFRLDDRDLRLEQLRWQSQKTQLERQYQDAIARRDRASINIIAARIDQAEAQLQLVSVQQERARQTSAVNGRVIAGDLSQRLGGAVTKGEALFEVAPQGSYRVSLKIPESRINDIQPGQFGTLHLSALPTHYFPFEISRVTPVTLAEEGASYFIAEGELELSDDSLLQPGMEGVGKVDIDQRLLISIWTRELQEWLQLKIWMWGGG